MVPVDLLSLLPLSSTHVYIRASSCESLEAVLGCQGFPRLGFEEGSSRIVTQYEEIVTDSSIKQFVSSCFVAVLFAVCICARVVTKVLNEGCYRENK
jgi:hypothetical protein